MSKRKTGLEASYDNDANDENHMSHLDNDDGMFLVLSICTKKI